MFGWNQVNAWLLYKLGVRSDRRRSSWMATPNELRRVAPSRRLAMFHTNTRAPRRPGRR